MPVINWLCRFLLMALLTSCTGLPLDQPFRPQLPAQEQEEELTELQKLRPQLRTLLQQREFLKTLQVLQQEVNSGMNAALLAGEYGQALQGGMMASADLAEKGEYSACGSYLRQLRDLYPRHRTTLAGVSVAEIQQRIESCSDQLMVKGLAAYRAGEMEEAINLWRALLVFDPKRVDAEKAIVTCSLQLHNLKPKI